MWLLLHLGADIQIRTDGSLWAWGANGNGQLGDGTAINQRSPVRIMENVRYFDCNNALVLLNDDSLWAFSTAWTEPIVLRKIEDSISSLKIGPGEWFDRSIRIYATKTDGSLWTWLMPQRLDSQLNNMYDTKPSYIPTKILNSIVSVHPGGSWTLDFEDDSTIDPTVELYLQQIPTGNAGTHVLTSDGKLWRIGNHEPVEVMDSVVRFSNSPTEVNLALRADGTIWSWRDSRTFLPASDTTPEKPALILEGLNP
jgi:alpha-tubulin suppressor-like RCC1 family protein